MKNVIRARHPLIAKICIIVIGLHNPSVLAQTPDTTLNDTDILDYDESHAQSIDQQIMCPVCPAETIDQAQVPIAKQMRQVVREQLAMGATEAEILAFFADRYGQAIIGAPPKSGFNLIAWIFPIAVLTGALVASIFVLRSMTGKPIISTTLPTNEIDSELQPFLELVDSDLGLAESDHAENLPGGPSDDG